MTSALDWLMNDLRINIVGTSGSGKTTLAKQLARKLNCPHIELDRMYWGPHWTPLAEEQLLDQLAEKLVQPKWVLDGNYSMTDSIKWRSVTHVIWLDYSYPRTLWQACKRAVSRCISKEEIWPGTGNRETIRRTFFSHESIILWTMTSYFRVRKTLESKMNDPENSHITFFRSRNQKQTARYVSSLLD